MIDVADVEGAVSRCEHVHSVLLHVYSAESIGESIFYDVGVNLIWLLLSIFFQGQVWVISKLYTVFMTKNFQ